MPVYGAGKTGTAFAIGDHHFVTCAHVIKDFSDHGAAEVFINRFAKRNIAKWRRSHGRGPWRFAQSPHRYLNKVAPDTTIVAITGSEDDNTQPGNARDYIAKAKARGLDARFVRAEGAGHGYLLTATVVRASEHRVRTLTMVMGSRTLLRQLATVSGPKEPIGTGHSHDPADDAGRADRVNGDIPTTPTAEARNPERL